MNQPKNQINVPGAAIAISGLKAQVHLLTNTNKRNLHPFDAGLDLIPASTNGTIAYDQTIIITVDTFLHLVPPPGIFGFITNRSSTPDLLKGGMIIPGAIDTGYTGEIKIRISCHSEYYLQVSESLDQCAKEQIPIAQIIFIPCLFPVLQEMELAKLAGIGGRGNQGFGSTNGKIYGA